jgi:hypothetical protein
MLILNLEFEDTLLRFHAKENCCVLDITHDDNLVAKCHLDLRDMIFLRSNLNEIIETMRGDDEIDE